MITLIHIMKSALYLCATAALLRSVSGLLLNHDQQDPIAHQPHASPEKVANLTNSTTEYLAIQAVAQVEHIVPPSPPLLPSTPKVRTTDAAPNFHIGTTTSKWATTYTPYTTDQTCKSSSTIATDIAALALAGFTTIRLYAIDCSILFHLPPLARQHNLRLILGIHVDDSALSYAQAQLDAIIRWASTSEEWDLVELIVVGNEAIFNEYTSAHHIASFISHARELLQPAGYTGPITTTEPLSILSENAHILCPVIDIAAANIQPFFHADISADLAGEYVALQLEMLERVCEGRELQAVSLETGWPRMGRRNGEAVPGVLEQRIAMEGILEGGGSWQGGVGGRIVVAGFWDEGWRDEGEFGVEGSWGCGHLFA